MVYATIEMWTWMHALHGPVDVYIFLAGNGSFLFEKQRSNCDRDAVWTLLFKAAIISVQAYCAQPYTRDATFTIIVETIFGTLQ